MCKEYSTFTRLEKHINLKRDIPHLLEVRLWIQKNREYWVELQASSEQRKTFRVFSIDIGKQIFQDTYKFTFFHRIIETHIREASKILLKLFTDFFQTCGAEHSTSIFF